MSIQIELLAATSTAGDHRARWARPLSVAARELILSTLEHCGGERKRTAEMLGICTKTLYNRLREYGIRESSAPPDAAAGVRFGPWEKLAPHEAAR